MNYQEFSKTIAGQVRTYLEDNNVETFGQMTAFANRFFEEIFKVFADLLPSGYKIGTFIATIWKKLNEMKTILQ